MTPWALSISVVAHVVVFLLFTVPFFNRTPSKSVPTPVTVKVLPIAKKTNLPEKKKKKAVKDQKRKKDMKAQKKKKQKKATTEIQKKTPQKKQEVPKKKVLPKKDNKPKHEEKKVKPKKPTLDEDFSDMLKTVEDLPDKVEDKKTEGVASDVPKRIEEILSMSESDVLKHQIEQCWERDPGLNGADNFFADLEVIMNPDATVESVKIKLDPTLAKNPYYRVATEKMKRALYHPDCTPLKLPKSKFEQWHTFIVTFDPREMFE